MKIKVKPKEPTRYVILPRINAGLLCFIIYSMLISNAHCQIVSVGSIEESKGFKKCFVLVRTKELKDETTGEVIRKSGDFSAEVALSNDKWYQSLLDAALPIPADGGSPQGEAAWLPCFFILRSFTYKEKGLDKLGKQLQLRRWWR